MLALLIFILADPALAGTAVSIAFIGMAAVALVVLTLCPFRPQMFWPGAVLLLVMAGAEALVEMEVGLRWSSPLAYGATAAFTALAVVALLAYIMNSRPITADKVFAAVSAYVLIAVVFATLFSLLQVNQPQAFHVHSTNEPDGNLDWSALMYFSFTVLTSTGFGEITPTTHQARSLIVIEQVLGVMYVAFLIARLANMYQEQRRGRR
ncbi:MAG: potassium channel family protein [Reyranellaceae bacterium]